MKLSQCLEIILENINTIKKIKGGLCHLSLRFIEDFYDEYETSMYINHNKPFTLYSHRTKSLYWWKPGKVGPRRRWLKKHIKKLQEKGL